MSELNCYSPELQAIYQELGIDLSKLGCIMLELQPVFVPDLDEADLYYSPTQKYAQGYVGGEAHVTLLYGLMPEVQAEHVDIVLNGWSVTSVQLGDIEAFESTNGEEYYCVHAAVDLESNPELLDAHQRLSLLPHVNTFLTYEAHVTLAYVNPDALDRVTTALRTALAGARLLVTGLNYGDTLVASDPGTEESTETY